MITTEKLAVYREFNGDVNRWLALTSGADNSGLTRDDWQLIHDLVFQLNCQYTGSLNPEFSVSLEPRLVEATADEQTRLLMHHIATRGWFQHPVFGNIIPELDHRSWWTDVLRFEGLDFEGQICAFTQGEPPSETQFEAMVNAWHATPEMKREMALHIFNVFEEILPAYREASEHYGELPLINEPDDVWQALGDLRVFVCDGSHTGEGHSISTTFSFRLGFDPDHEMNVEYQNGQIVDVVCEG
jgi:hypothetical protein